MRSDNQSIDIHFILDTISGDSDRRSDEIMSAHYSGYSIRRCCRYVTLRNFDKRAYTTFIFAIIILKPTIIFATIFVFYCSKRAQSLRLRISCMYRLMLVDIWFQFVIVLFRKAFGKRHCRRYNCILKTDGGPPSYQLVENRRRENLFIRALRPNQFVVVCLLPLLLLLRRRFSNCG